MSKLFGEDSDSEAELQTNNEFAKNYNNWRRKEELNKLKTKYGDEDLLQLGEESSSSSEDDEEGVEWTEAVEKDFFKTLACLKKKDPRIYDDKVKFFTSSSEITHNLKKKNKKDKPMTIKDYERKLILEKGGQFSDEEEDVDNRPRSPTYVEEQKKLKEMFKQAENFNNENDSDDETGGMFKARQKTEEELKEANDYKQWLAGKKDKCEDQNVEDELQPLKEYWNNPNLDDGEKFIRNYILNEEYLKKEEEDHIPTYEEIIHDSDKDLSEDEKAVDQQEEFEHKYNFRFEEPDQDFIKRYPRTVESSLRKTNDKRKLKRQETKERKQKEKEQKMQDIKQLQELKRKEIEDKIEKLKEITGNDDIGFNNVDLDGDFDPEEHDRKMQALFNDEFYQGSEDEQKPEFPEIDEYLELERWDKYENSNEQETDLHCEDEDFNMDADYDPQTSVQKELMENSKGKKKRKRKSLFAKALNEPKPVFDSTDKSYQEYIDEYYKLDCEDIIGDIPCRFKYRQVIPNNFGLTVEEILKAKDRELNKWCSLKKAVQLRPDHVEKYDQIAFQRKADNIALKRRILPSLFENEEGNEDNSAQQESQNKNRNMVKVKSKNLEEKNTTENETKEQNGNEDNNCTSTNNTKKKKKSKTIASEEKEEIQIKTERIEDVQNSENSPAIKSEVNDSNQVKKNKKKKKKKKQQQPNQQNVSTTNKHKRKHLDSKTEEVPKKKFKKNKQKTDNIGISDARLSAYGINPKKFKNKLKYGNKK